MKTVLIVSGDPVTARLVGQLLSPGFQTILMEAMAAAIEAIYNELPSLVVADLSGGAPSTIQMLNILKEDPLFKQIPILAVLDDQQDHILWEELFVEDYLRRSDLAKDLLTRASLDIVRSERIVESNPLTRLPGNISIYRQIEGRLRRSEPFSFAYFDLDHFKPFNDRYGFGRGDEVIRITGRLIANIVQDRQPQKNFVGHIGGDDFVCIMQPELIESACTDILQAFDQIVPTFYDPEDRERGGIDSVDRQGRRSTFPFVSLSIGITSTAKRRFSHFGELVGAASEMKSQAKKAGGGVFKTDHRTDPLEKASV